MSEQRTRFVRRYLGFAKNKHTFSRRLEHHYQKIRRLRDEKQLTMDEAVPPPDPVASTTTGGRRNAAPERRAPGNCPKDRRAR